MIRYESTDRYELLKCNLQKGIVMKRLTLCMAVANHPKIERCLDSVRHLVDEIVIADMGMTDPAKAICLSYGAEITDWRGSEHTSDALNFALQHATGDWIIWLNPNEYLVETACPRFRDLLYEPDTDLIFLHMVEVMRTKEDRLRMMDFARPRLFRHHLGFQFTGKDGSTTLNFESASLTPAMMDRIGMHAYKIKAELPPGEPSGGKGTESRKAKRADNESTTGAITNPWTYYELACESFRLRDYKQVVLLLNTLIQQFLDRKRIPPAIVYKLKYASVLDQPYFPDTDRGLELAVKLYPDCTDLHFYTGLVQYKKNRYREAIQAFELCLEYGEDSQVYFNRQGTGSYQAHYYKGLCLEKMNKLKDAAAAYIRSIASFQSYVPAIEALKKLTEANRIDLTVGLNEEAGLPLDRLQSILYPQ